jgi:hypothetical protein
MLANRAQVHGMPSARILRFPSSARRRQVPPATVRHALSRRSAYPSGGFALLLAATLLAAFLYLSGVANVARHDALYAAALIMVWCLYFLHDRLRRLRTLGPVVTLAGELLPPAAALSFFSFVLWLVLSHP